MPPKTACFTGHRPKSLFGYQNAPYEIMRQYLTDIVSYFYEQKDTRVFITGGAQGIDQIAFWAIEHAKRKYPDIKSILYAPCVKQDEKWSDKGTFSKSEYQRILKLADEVVYISNTTYQSNEQMIDRDKAMVDASDFVIGVLEKDEEYKKNPSGTAVTLRYAEKQNKVIYGIYYQKDENEFTDITAKHLYGEEDIFFQLKNKLYTGYFAKTKEYKAAGLHPVSIARVTPVHIPCEKLGIFAPPPGLLTDFKQNPELSDEEYKERYLKHLQSIDIKKTLSSLPPLNNEEGYVLMCYEKPDDFCHRHILADYLNETYHLNIKETGLSPEKEAEEFQEEL